MEDYYNKASQTAEYILSRLDAQPDIAIVLGSGLGPLVNEIEKPVEMDYSDIPHFPLTTVKGHAGKLVAGEIAGKQVLAMKGRFHYYEGYDIEQVVYAIRSFKRMGISNLLVTNAAGGVNRNFQPGDLMFIRDHIGLYAPSPLRGKNVSEFGPRFPDMSEVYSRKLLAEARKASEECGIPVREGVYAYTQGPMYETPAEIQALEILGADAVGMSTVPEAVTARHAGMNVLGISCITNMAAGILNQPLNHEEVIRSAKEVEEKFTRLVKKIIQGWEK